VQNAARIVFLPPPWGGKWARESGNWLDANQQKNSVSHHILRIQYELNSFLLGEMFIENSLIFVHYFKT
jgi:hypothetical protein